MLTPRHRDPAPRCSDPPGRTRAGWACSLAIEGLLFGARHAYHGLPGLVLNAVDGVGLGAHLRFCMK
jgi:hypothetical protein